MSFFDQVYHSIFGAKNEQEEINVHELLKRSAGFKKRYEQWFQKKSFKPLIRMISDHYALKLKGVDQTPQVHVLKSEYSNGFSVSLAMGLEKEDMQFLMDYFAERVIKLGYQVSLSDYMAKTLGDDVQVIEKYYLKPVRSDVQPINQKFGNIIIEFQVKYNEESNLKLLANVYSDRSYTKALPFDQLIERLFRV